MFKAEGSHAVTESTTELLQHDSFNWVKHPVFIEVAFCYSTTLDGRSRLLPLAPHYLMPDFLAADGELRSQCQKDMVQRLRFEELFETNMFPPTPIPGPASHRPQDMYTTTIDNLLQIAFSAVLNPSLSWLNISFMQRFACILYILSKYNPAPSFQTLLFPTSRPYLQIMNYICSNLFTYRSAPGNGFMARECRQNLSPFHECIQISKKANILIYFNIDTPIPVPTAGDLAVQKAKEADSERILKTKPTAADKRRARRQQPNQQADLSTSDASNPHP